MTAVSLYTAAQVRELDRVAIEDFGTPGLELMERAGRRTFDQVVRRYPGQVPVVVLCGSGNNGGDGYVVARLLHEIGVEVHIAATAEPGTPDTREMCRRYLDAGGRPASRDCGILERAALVIDAMLGTGLSRAPEGISAEFIRAVGSCRCPVVAVDLPSGLSGDTGRAFDPCIRADLTVTFIGRKLGQYTADGPDHCGELVFDSLGLDRAVYREVPAAAVLTRAPELRPRPRNSHKGMYGHLVVAGGEAGMLGAMLLAGRAGLRSGAGLVTVLSVASNLDRAPLAQPELMMRTYSPDRGPEEPFAGADAVVFGPGTAGGEWSAGLFGMLAKIGVPVLLDAGGLHLLAAMPDRNDNRVLTPHPGEAAALLGCRTGEIQADRPAAAAEIQRRYGGVCVLKGAGTVIHGTGTEICDRGNPGMASAGTGDVLSGIIGALLAQGLSPWDAARQGVWLHGAAGDLASGEVGERSLTATDVIGHLPAVLQELTG